MKNRDDALIRKILEYCKESEEAIRIFGDDIEIFEQNSVFRNAACMPILQIGEMCKLISAEMRESNPQIDWSGWCGIRDIMAHQYTNLDYKKTWKILKTDEPLLKENLKIIADSFDRSAIIRIHAIMRENQIDGIDPKDVYKKIVDGTGISMNAFTDEKILEFIKNAFS